jgi:hypothetical protein
MERSRGAIQLAIRMKEKGDLRCHFIGNSDKRKGSFISKKTHCLLGIREQSGGAWWLDFEEKWVYMPNLMIQ